MVTNAQSDYKNDKLEQEIAEGRKIFKELGDSMRASVKGIDDLQEKMKEVVRNQMEIVLEEKRFLNDDLPGIISAGGLIVVHKDDGRVYFHKEAIKAIA